MFIKSMLAVRTELESRFQWLFQSGIRPWGVNNLEGVTGQCPFNTDDITTSECNSMYSESWMI